MYLCVSVVICRWRRTNSAGEAKLERLFIRFSLELICQLAGYTNYWDGDINVILSNVINSFLTLSEPEVSYMLLLSSNSKWPIQTKKIFLPTLLPWTLSSVTHDEGMGIAEDAVLLLVALSTPGDLGSCCSPLVLLPLLPGCVVIGSSSSFPLSKSNSSHCSSGTGLHFPQQKLQQNKQQQQK